MMRSCVLVCGPARRKVGPVLQASPIEALSFSFTAIWHLLALMLVSHMMDTVNLCYADSC